MYLDELSISLQHWDSSAFDDRTALAQCQEISSSLSEEEEQQAIVWFQIVWFQKVDFHICRLAGFKFTACSSLGIHPFCRANLESVPSASRHPSSALRTFRVSPSQLWCRNVSYLRLLFPTTCHRLSMTWNVTSEGKAMGDQVICTERLYGRPRIVGLWNPETSSGSVTRIAFLLFIILAWKPSSIFRSKEMAEAHWSGCDRGPGKQNDCCPGRLWIFVFVRGVAGCGIFLDLAEQQQGLYGTSGVVGPSGAITVGDCYDHRSLPRHRHHTITIPSPLPPPSASSYHHHHQSSSSSSSSSALLSSPSSCLHLISLSPCAGRFSSRLSSQGGDGSCESTRRWDSVSSGRWATRNITPDKPKHTWQPCKIITIICNYHISWFQ